MSEYTVIMPFLAGSGQLTSFLSFSNCNVSQEFKINLFCVTFCEIFYITSKELIKLLSRNLIWNFVYISFLQIKKYLGIKHEDP
jgi:hypothetical protein